MKENNKISKNKELELVILSMEKNLQVNLLMIGLRDMDHFFNKMAKLSQAFGKMIN